MSRCPLCEAPTRHRYELRDLNLGITDEQFEYRQCEGCAVLFLAEVPSDLGRYYPASYYTLFHAQRPSPMELAKLQLVQRFAREGDLVEVGPGAGAFANLARLSGFRVTGIEMDERACQHLRDTVGVDAIHTDDPTRALESVGSAGVIAMWHVIEHLRDPWGVLEAAAAALRPGGVMLIATPNPAAVQLRLLGARWTHLDAPRHLFLIPIPTLTARARAAGLTVAGLELADRPGRDWNAFGWARALRPGRPGRVVSKVGAGLALALAPIERTGWRGTTYTAILQKAPASVGTDTHPVRPELRLMGGRQQ